MAPQIPHTESIPLLTPDLNNLKIIQSTKTQRKPDRELRVYPERTLNINCLNEAVGRKGIAQETLRVLARGRVI